LGDILSRTPKLRMHFFVMGKSPLYNERTSRLSLLLEPQLSEDLRKGLVDYDITNHSHHRKTGMQRTYLALF